MRPMNTRHPRPLRMVLLICAVAFLVACSGHYGHLKSENEVTQMFRASTVPGNYNYYYAGRRSSPYAIIGIHAEYQHRSKVWSSVEPNGFDFARMVDRLWTPPGNNESGGAYIFDQQGRRVGIWYSYYRSTVVFLKEDGVVTVASPYIPTRGGP